MVRQVHHSPTAADQRVDHKYFSRDLYYLGETIILQIRCNNSNNFNLRCIHGAIMKMYQIIVLALLFIVHVHSQEKPELRIHNSFQGGEISFSPDLKYFISGWKEVFLYETKTLKHLQTYNLTPQQSSFYGFISDFHFVNGDSVYDIRNTRKAVVVVTDEIKYFDPHNQRIFCFGQGELIIKRFDTDFRLITTIKDRRLNGQYSILDTLKNGKYILVATDQEENDLLVLDLDQGKVIRSCTVGFDFNKAMFINLDHALLTNTSKRNNEFIIFSLSENKSTKTIKCVFNHTDIPNSFRFLKDGKYAVSPFIDGSIKIWDPLSGEIIKTLSKDGYEADGVYVTADEKNILSTSTNHFPVIWNLQTGESFDISVPNIEPVGKFEILPIDKLGVLVAVRVSGAEGCMFRFNLLGKVEDSIREIWFPTLRHLEIPPDDLLLTYQDDLLTFRELQNGKVTNRFRVKNIVKINYDRVITKENSLYKIWSCPDFLKIAEFESKEKMEFNNWSKLLGARQITPGSFEVLDIFGQSRISLFSPKIRHINSPFYHSSISSQFFNSDLFSINQFNIIYSDSQKTARSSISESRTIYDIQTGDVLVDYDNSASPEEWLGYSWLRVSKDSKYAVFPDRKNHTHQVFDLQKKQVLFSLNRDSNLFPHTIEFETVQSFV